MSPSPLCQAGHCFTGQRGASRVSQIMELSGVQRWEQDTASRFEELTTPEGRQVRAGSVRFRR